MKQIPLELFDLVSQESRSAQRCDFPLQAIDLLFIFAEVCLMPLLEERESTVCRDSAGRRRGQKFNPITVARTVANCADDSHIWSRKLDLHGFAWQQMNSGIQGHSAFADFAQASRYYNLGPTTTNDDVDLQIDLMSLPATGVCLRGFHFSR